jgi:hypothetical protein
MKFLCYRGVVYKRFQAIIDLMQAERFSKEELAPQSVKILCYRGVFYLQKIRPKPCSEPVRLTQEHHSMQLAHSNESWTMQNKQMGHLYKLYCIGWRNGSLKQFSLLYHWVLSLFFYYRQGFAEGTEWKQAQISKF